MAIDTPGAKTPVLILARALPPEIRKQLAETVLKAAPEGPLAELAALDDAAFRALFRKSPVKRIGRNRFVRNVLYAIGNSGEPRLRAVAERLLDDPDPVVADAAAWAVGRLAGCAGTDDRTTAR